MSTMMMIIMVKYFYLNIFVVVDDNVLENDHQLLSNIKSKN